MNQATEYRPPAVDTWDPATTYTYDLDRALTRVLRPDGIAIDFTYDAGGRVSEVSFPGGLVEYGYDPVTGNLTGVNGPYGGALSMSYDGSLPTEVTWLGEVSGTVGATYDHDFRLAGLAVNGTDTVAFGYDADGLLTSAGALMVGREAATGRVGTTTVASVVGTQSYSGFGELDSLGWHAGGAPLLGLSYTRDAVGRIETKTETRGGATTTYAYAYDLAGRLVEVRENGVPTEAYTYDANGNRLQATTSAGTVTGTYDAQDRLLTYGATAFEYTRNGELTARIEGADTTHYTYDVLGNLLEVALADGTAIEYAVDAVGRRIGRKVDGQLTQGWLYQDGLNPVAELDSLGGVTARFVYGTRANVPEYLVKGGVTYRIVADELGSVRLVVDAATGAVVQELRYDAWGRVLLDTNPGFQPFGYAGGLYDPATGLVRFGARDYDPAIGRWTSKDPIGLRGGTNVYGYVAADPTNLTDESGLDPWAGPIGSLQFQFGVFGIGGSAGSLTNTRTGETCFVALVCGRGGLGIIAAGGIEVLGLSGPSCGVALSGLSVGLGADLAAPGLPGINSLAIAYGAGAISLTTGTPLGIGLGLSLGVDACYLRVVRCVNTPGCCG